MQSTVSACHEFQAVRGAAKSTPYRRITRQALGWRNHRRTFTQEFRDIFGVCSSVSLSWLSAHGKSRKSCAGNSDYQEEAEGRMVSGRGKLSKKCDSVRYDWGLYS